jgi:hypothetical protein
MNGMECWIDSRLEAVRIPQVQAYLFARGWQSLPYPRSELLVFQGASDDAGQPIVQILPASETMPDYRPRLVELITALAAIEDRTAAAILEDLLGNPIAAVNGAGSGQASAPGVSSRITK